eukprot:3237383-Prymnesium_polylepis.2
MGAATAAATRVGYSCMAPPSSRPSCDGCGVVWKQMRPRMWLVGVAWGWGLRLGVAVGGAGGVDFFDKLGTPDASQGLTTTRRGHACTHRRVFFAGCWASAGVVGRGRRNGDGMPETPPRESGRGPAVD